MRSRIVSSAPYIAIAGIACLVVALGARLALAGTQTWMEIVGAIGLLLAAISVLLRPAELKAAITGRTARYGGNALVMSLAFLLIIGLVNYLGSRHHLRWDVTAEKRFSLSEQSLQVLRSLNEPVRVMAFFTPGAYNRQDAEDLLKEYALRSDKLTYQFLDPDLQRREAMDYQITRDGTIVFERGSRREQTVGTQEQDLTSALLKVMRDKPKGVYFLAGHQERDPEISDPEGYSTVKSTLLSENYQVGSFNLAVTSTVPSDMSVLIIAGPQKPFSAEENQRLAGLINGGGRLLIMVDAGMPDPFGGTLRSFGIDFPDSLVIDPTRSLFGDPGTPLVDSYPYHQITKDMGRLTTFFPTVRPIAKADPGLPNWSVTFLATSSPNAWAETSYRDSQVRPDANEAKGALGLVAVVQSTAEVQGKGRMVVFGDADLVANGPLGAVRGTGNMDLFMNSVNWLAEEESLITIRPVQPEDRQVTLTGPQAEAIIYSNILFVPLLVLAAGGIVWWKRR